MLLRNLVLLAAAAALGLQILATQAWAGQRVALVIGNASYAHAPSLANPLNDAADIGAALERLDFAVTRIENADQVELRRGLQRFSLAASASEMAVVFYAGHGIEVDKRNFLIPVDARLLSDADVEFEAVPMDLLSRAVERAKGLRLIILDACRDNPFAVAMQRAGATRSIGRGLASVELSGETLVAYAAKEGTVAADGEGRNSPYTTALLAHLEERGLEVGLMFRKVRDAVLATTGGRQEPFVYGSLSSEGAYLAALPEPEPEPTPPPQTVTVQGGEDPKPPDPDQVVERRIAAEKEMLFWESVKDSTHAADFEAYLQQFPGGTYEALARNRLERLTPPPSNVVTLSPSNNDPASTEYQNVPHLPTKGVWKTRNNKYVIELKKDGGRAFAIVHIPSGFGQGICAGDISNSGRVDAWCRWTLGTVCKLVGVFPNLQLLGACASSFIFDYDNENANGNQ